MLRLADNVFVIEHDDATDEWPHGNTGVIVGRTGVFVIDSCYLPSRARADIALIRRVTDKPVRFPGDDALAFRPQQRRDRLSRGLPGVTLIAERNTARWIELNQEYWKALSTAPDSARRTRWRRSRRSSRAARRGRCRVQRRRARSARDVVAAPRRSWRNWSRSRSSCRRSCSTAGSASISRALRIEIEDRGPANSPNDATVWLPQRAHPVRRRHPRALAAALCRRLLARALGPVLRDIEALPHRRHRAGPRTGA